MIIANNKSEKVPCMGFELGSLHSGTSDVIINSSRLSATPPSWVGFAVSNSVVSGRRADTTCGRVWFGFFSHIKNSRPN